MCVFLHFWISGEMLTIFDQICRLEGTMSPQARDATIKHFSKEAFYWHCFLLTCRNLVNNVGVVVFLVSLKAGGVALNLTEASRVYLMDSWWNPAVRTSLRHSLKFLTFHQNSIGWISYVSKFSRFHAPFSMFSAEAMDRIHRLGQRRPVRAIKLVIEDSIESRIIQVRRRPAAFSPFLTWATYD